MTQIEQFEQLSSPSPDAGRENVIHFITNEKTCTFTFSQPRYVTKVKKLAQSHPDEVIIHHENPDGSIVGKLPTAWALKLTPKRQVSEEQKLQAAERLKKMRESKM